MVKAAGGNFPPHFEKLRGGKAILAPPLFGIEFKEKKKAFLLYYGSRYCLNYYLVRQVRQHMNVNVHESDQILHLDTLM